MSEEVEKIAVWMPPEQAEAFLTWAGRIEARLGDGKSYQEKVAGLAAGNLAAAAARPEGPIIPLKPFGKLGGS